MRKVFKSAVVLFVIAIVTGCASTETIVAKPVVELRSVALTDLSFTGQTFMLSFDVDNPNPFPLPIRAVRYHVQLDKQSFANGETPGEFSIPAGGSGSFDISVEVDVLKSASRLSSVLKSGIRQPVEYELNGTLAVDIPYVEPLPFNHTGHIKIASN